MKSAILLAVVLMQAVAQESSSETKASKPKVLVSADLLWHTKDFVNDVYSTAYVNYLEKHVATAKGHVVKTVSEDPVQLVCDKVGVKKADIMAKYTQAEAAAVHARSVAVDALAQASQPLDDAAAQIADKIEAAVPKHKGKIPRSAPEMFVFFVYLAIFCYVALKVALLGP